MADQVAECVIPRSLRAQVPDYAGADEPTNPPEHENDNAQVIEPQAAENQVQDTQVINDLPVQVQQIIANPIVLPVNNPSPLLRSLYGIFPADEN
ncbi:unnamed protein product [Rhizoctonia solani]|uniref:Uncharacterized protein n=1 Tax=Rhizoctonia solani TaxID=456999 RepID=A0A8H3AJX4_9AGAM|nr:unnamed protein product [Rhizoctonia solani]